MERTGAENPSKVKRGLSPWPVTALSLAIIIALGLLAWLQMGRYERAVLDIYAGAQDGHVQSVLEQIALAEEQGGTEAQAEGLLATLDPSPTRSWALSRQSALIFVRDAGEAENFQDLTADQSASVQGFMDALEPGRVSHDAIRIGGQTYIASGARFAFQGTEYQLCLLTGAKTVLDHSAYQAAKVNLISLALMALAIFVVGMEILSLLASDYRKRCRAAVEGSEDQPRQSGEETTAH